MSDRNISLRVEILALFYRKNIDMDPSVVFSGSVYLIQIKESVNYGARDLLWAIGTKLEEPLDYNGMKGLVKNSNGRGLITQ